MRATLQTINEMQAAGVVRQYAIGGAVGATFYLEPAATLDVDIFVLLPANQKTTLVSLAPIYKYMEDRGHRPEREHIVIEGWPVQFLITSNGLEEEAIAEAVETDVDGVRTRVMSAEHLVAIALNTGRSKDHSRILNFLEQQAVDLSKLETILRRHRLWAQWQEFKRRFLDE